MPEALEPVMAEVELFDGALAARHHAIVYARFVHAEMQYQLREAVIDRFFATQPTEPRDGDDGIPTRIRILPVRSGCADGDGGPAFLRPVPPDPRRNQSTASADWVEPTSALTEPHTDDMRCMVEDLKDAK